jgi:uroporphyrinogen decarboxylase
VEKMFNYWIEFFDHYIDAIGDYVEVVWMGDDWGTQVGPIMNPSIFRSMFVSRYKALTDSIKKKKKHIKIALHSCGSVRWGMEDLIEAGIDILHPLQGDANEFGDPSLLKKDFKGRMAFYSNIRNQSVLPNGTPDEVEAEVKYKMKYLAPGGGYILSGGHNIQADVPARNILALYDTGFKYGHYPINL